VIEKLEKECEVVKIRKTSSIFSTILAASLVLTALPANASDPGITSSEIVFGMQLPQTGAASPGYNKIDDATRAYFDYVNSKGGVNGRNLRLVVKDDVYNAGNTLTSVAELINDDKVFGFLGNVGTPTQSAVIDRINRDGIPHLFTLTGYSKFYSNPKKYPTTFGGLGTYFAESKIVGEYVKKTFAGKKVGILYQTDDFGRDALAGFNQVGLRFEDGKTAAKFVSGTQGSLGLTSQLNQLKTNGVEVVLFAAVASALAIAVSTANAIGYKPANWVVTSVGADATTFQTILGARGVPAASSAALLNGVITASFAPAPTEATDPYVAAFKKINDEFNKGPDKRWDNNILIGMNNAYLLVQALHGVGKNVTRKNLISYLETNGKKMSGAAFTPLGYSKSSHAGYIGYWIGKYDAQTNITPVDAKRVVYTTDSGKGAVRVLTDKTFKRAPVPADTIAKGVK
jgi:ABC-type branched-subunit amino acid transport system substrate-binding protein